MPHVHTPRILISSLVSSRRNHLSRAVSSFASNRCDIETLYPYPAISRLPCGKLLTELPSFHLPSASLFEICLKPVSERDSSSIISRSSLDFDRLTRHFTSRVIKLDFSRLLSLEQLPTLLHSSLLPLFLRHSYRVVLTASARVVSDLVFLTVTNTHQKEREQSARTLVFVSFFLRSSPERSIQPASIR